MRQIYQVGLTLTFMLLCISVMQTIVVSQIGDLTPNRPIGEMDTIDFNISDETGVTVSSVLSTFPSGQGTDFATGGSDIIFFVKQMAFGWQSVLHDIFAPVGLVAISDALSVVFTAIQGITITYTIFLLISALRGGVS